MCLPGARGLDRQRLELSDRRCDVDDVDVLSCEQLAVVA